MLALFGWSVMAPLFAAVSTTDRPHTTLVHVEGTRTADTNPAHGNLVLGLIDKYRAIRELRDNVEAHAPNQARALMVALASRFPGALRELDELPHELIAARLSELEATLASRSIPQRWMLLQASYHGYMRAALRLRRQLRGPSALADAQQILASYRHEADEPPLEHLDEAALRTIARPPGGRLNPWVFAQVAGLHGTTAEEVHRALFLR
jgi:hypothetical protein